MKVAAFAVALIGGVLSTAAQANLITNGNFMTGDFSGWTLTTIDPNDANYIYAPGTGGAFLGPVSDAFLSQSFATVAGDTYQVSFRLSNPSAAAGTQFSAFFNTDSLYSVKDTAVSPTTFTFDAVATGSTSKLTFGFKNIPDYFNLSRVSVSPVPEPEAYVMMLGGLALLGGIVGFKRRSNTDFGMGA